MEKKNLEISTCNLCQGKKSKLKYQVDGFNVVQCIDCGLVYLKNPLPIADEPELYNNYYNIRFGKDYHQNSDEPGLRTLWEINNERIKLIKSVRFQGKLLDIGSGQGFFLFHAKQEGFSVTGIDVSSQVVKFCEQTFQIKVYFQNVNQHFSLDEQFDIITLWHILEHLSDPLEFLKKIQNNLTPRGILIIEVPNIKSLKFLLASDPNRWIGGNHPRHHKFFFSLKTLSSILQKAGYSPVKRLNLNYDLSKNSLPKKFVKKLLKRMDMDSFIDVMAFK